MPYFMNYFQPEYEGDFLQHFEAHFEASLEQKSIWCSPTAKKFEVLERFSLNRDNTD